MSDEVQQVSFGQVTRPISILIKMKYNSSHICSFWVGSTNFDETKMTFGLGRLEYNAANQNPVLDYIIEVEELPAR